ncbi:hypothetical protein COX93_01375 [Candidatus Nomurabacteria bacterium CG_4_10_14_0_2_um_filter_30_12]|uniref:Transcobalamin-like C-terminal domain-containing protein n=2 Tax=Candidatus Nomuraibacteriota TaxID=1752729 RepID=A0A2J0MR78_9BACT|nr:MAG: hypothetical protein COU48_01835 [Candidatus Nomurabacteria bacterium CG10_big_fil_rev_8_21_14_0_10_03_31_7]PIZ87361.1 MAG: hypothetical protein COX93_01375 [Candidatus Nomurabacteria bacterium CG_4_10_14_0_2_um_filter_30_12]
MNKKIKIIIGVIIFLSIFFLTLKIILKENNTPQNIDNIQKYTETNKIQKNKKINSILKEDFTTLKTILEINGIKYESETEKEISIYDFMNKLKKEGKINFKDKTYSGMGKLIEEINGIKPNNEKYWIYYVNNKKANIGISDYKINPGDVVSWKLEKI